MLRDFWRLRGSEGFSTKIFIYWFSMNLYGKERDGVFDDVGFFVEFCKCY